MNKWRFHKSNLFFLWNLKKFDITSATKFCFYAVKTKSLVHYFSM